MKQKVLVAISGGVDSGLAAALLKKAGFEVWGAFLKLADSASFKQGEKKALEIAKALDVPFLVLDLRKEFNEKIIKMFLKECWLGRTPNPCVVCNKEIKLGLLLKQARSLGFDFLATGHYVRKKKGKKDQLLVAKDKKKDQSYFLWQLTQDQLKHLLFPMGGYTKLEAKKMAKKLKLPVADKESQEICFIPETTDQFLKKNLKTRPGKIVNTQGELVGQHQGLFLYTIGQRKGMRIGGAAKPFYVLAKDLKKNTLIVTQNEKDLARKELVCHKVNWIAGKKPQLPLKVKARIRYRHKAASAIVRIQSQKSLKVVFDYPQRAITPGQSVVFYKGQELLGGGIIK